MKRKRRRALKKELHKARKQLLQRRLQQFIARHEGMPPPIRLYGAHEVFVTTWVQEVEMFVDYPKVCAVMNSIPDAPKT